MTENATTGMACPICRVGLVMTDRQGIEIDYCPNCRGVWLDRGELDKIIERSLGDGGAGAGGQRGYAKESDGRDRQGHGGHGFGGHGRERDGHGRSGSHGGRRDSFFGRLFD